MVGWLKRQVARAAAAVGLLPLLTDVYLFLRFRRASRTVAAAEARQDPAGEEPWQGLKLPPAWLRFSSSGTDGVDWFLRSGEQGAALVRRLAEETGVEPGERAILDYGCGCGRVLRHLGPDDAATVWGVDWNRRAVRWCSKSLPHASFVVGSLAPPLAVPESERFHLIYAFSVFTHMPTTLQQSWLEELMGRLAPGGVLAVSTHGDDFRDDLSESERRLYDQGEIVVRQAGVAGTNVCAAYHPPGSLERILPRLLSVSAHETAGAVGNPPQDLWVLRKH